MAAAHSERTRELSFADDGLRGAEARPNPFVETALSFALTYVAQRTTGLQTRHSIEPARLIILADKAYYSQPATDERRGGRFAKFSVTLGGAHKTGLGSSAALVTSLTAALLAHYLPPEILDVSTAEGRRSLHNLAQAAHCAAQGKVGSGFDVAAAVFGSCQYRRFSPSLLSQLPEPASPGFGAKLVALVDQVAGWDVEVRKDGIDMPQGVVLRMCDVDCGSQTVSMVKKVLSWRAEHQERSTKLWDALQTSNEALAATLCRGDTDALPQMVGDVRRLIRDMSRLSDVPIEPERQTELLDALSEVEGVYGGVVPGAGGFDALALLTRRDDDTKGRVDAFLRRWSQENASKVRLLDVQGEMEGLRRENLDEYEGWL